MKACISISILTLSLLSISPHSARATGTDQTKANPPQRDGQHDFDFAFGIWKTHIKRFLDPLSGSNKSIELNGTKTTQQIWGGHAQWEEIEADGPNGHWQGMTLLLYNPEAHQWSQSFVNSKIGELTPPLIGAFKDGRGELFAQDTFNGRSILVRAVWSDIEPNSYHFEESYSDDGGKTWAPAFIANLTREKSAPAASTPTTDTEANQTGNARDGAHDFDFHFGTWKTHLWRLQQPLSGSSTWVEYEGISVVHKVWNGRASLFELEVDGPAGHIKGVGLRLYNPQSHQWSLNWANSKDGTLNQPMIGQFKDGRGAFFDQESFNGRTIFARNSFSDITPNSSRFEQAFSTDGGKTWETNWVMTFTRVKDESDRAH
jgi:hypothetical protein